MPVVCFARPVAMLLSLVSLSGCCAGSSSSQTECTGIITKAGRTYRAVAQGRDTDAAKRQVCNEYCVQNDKACEPVYQQWLKSPEGMTTRSSKSVAIYQQSGKAMLDCIARTCADGCVRDVAAGAIDCKVTCQ